MVGALYLPRVKSTVGLSRQGRCPYKSVTRFSRSVANNSLHKTTSKFLETLTNFQSWFEWSGVSICDVICFRQNDSSWTTYSFSPIYTFSIELIRYQPALSFWNDLAELSVNICQYTLRGFCRMSIHFSCKIFPSLTFLSIIAISLKGFLMTRGKDFLWRLDFGHQWLFPPQRF